jgi:hypothetical protein
MNIFPFGGIEWLVVDDNSIANGEEWEAIGHSPVAISPACLDA